MKLSVEHMAARLDHEYCIGRLLDLEPGSERK